MSTLITPRDVVAIIQRTGLRQALMTLVDYIDSDFRRWPQFDKIPRVAAHSANGVIELMPISDDSMYSFKYVNGHPKNFRHGLPTVMAFGGLADVATGVPLLLSELTLSTALRTAATSVLAARSLARRDAKSMALIGNGAQSEFQALAFHYLLGIETLRIYDVDGAASERLARHLASTPALRVEICKSTAEAVRGADIVTTVTADKCNATILTPEMIEPGMHVNGVGGDCPGKTELHRAVLERASVFVEYEPQSRIEGDVQQMPADFPVTELWQVLEKLHPGRRSADEVTVFDSVGFALEDFSMLRFLSEQARSLNLGQTIELVPQLKDPKNLFGLLAPEATSARFPEAELAIAS